MKLKKYTFKTPLFGSISCEEVLSDTDGHIELTPEQMCRLYDQRDKLHKFLTDNQEDLSSYVPEELTSVILRAEFGDFAMLHGRMYLRTYIWVEEDLTETGIEQIQEWISGQMSDGWGEGLEQRTWWEHRIEKPTIYFDEDCCEFETDTEYCHVYYYAHPWNSSQFEIELEECEEVEEDTKFEVVATMALPFHNRQVIKLSSGLGLKMFLRDFGQAEELYREIDDSSPLVKYTVYLVRDLDGNSGIELLPRWVYEAGSKCYFNDNTLEDKVRRTEMPVSKAILELLK